MVKLSIFPLLVFSTLTFNIWVKHVTIALIKIQNCFCCFAKPASLGTCMGHTLARVKNLAFFQRGPSTSYNRPVLVEDVTPSEVLPVLLPCPLWGPRCVSCFSAV